MSSFFLSPIILDEDAESDWESIVGLEDEELVIAAVEIVVNDNA
jgi:hypothetical protein